MLRLTSALVSILLLLGACGTSPGERSVSGAGIGAAGGAIVGAVTGLSVLNGALIGTAVGAITGAVTDSSTVNLGEPIWKQGGSSGATQTAASGGTTSDNAYLVRNIQSGLAQVGYDPGPADGVYGPRTRRAIGEYQEHNDLLVDGRPSRALLRHIQQQADRG